MSDKKEERTAADYVVGAIVISLLVVIVGGALFGTIYAFRWGLNVTAPITVHVVDKGVKCAISSGGEAIDCWKIEESE